MLTFDRKPGVALWGAGEHARRNLLPALEECNDVQLVGILTRNDAVRKEQGKKWACKIWTNPREMLEDHEIDVVYVSTPTIMHFECGMQVLEAGKHLWCEKSLTMTLGDSKKLIDFSLERGLALCEAFMYFYHTQFETLHNWLREGEVGKIEGVIARFGYPTILNSNALFENGVYPLSAVLDLMGETPKAILSASKNSTHLSFSAGSYAFIEWGFNRFYRNELEIWGEKGLIMADRIFSKPPTYSPKLILRKQDSVFEKMIPPENHFVKMLSAFSRALLDPVLQQQHRFRAFQMADLMSIILNK